MRRARSAPIAVRTAISGVRDAPRAIKSVARFAQTTIHVRTTAIPNTTARRSILAGTTSLRSGTNRTPVPSLSPGDRASMRRSLSRSAAATPAATWVADVPARSRPTAVNR